MGKIFADAWRTGPEALRLGRECPGVDVGPKEFGLGRFGLAVFTEDDGRAVERILAHGVETDEGRCGLDGGQREQGLEN